MEHQVELGTQGLQYGTKVAEEMIADRAKQLVEQGEDGANARRLAIGLLAAEGNLKTEVEVSGTERYLGERYLAASHPFAAGNTKVETAAEKKEREVYEEAKRVAKERGVPISTVMNEFVRKGKVKI